jgi:hypothetical protein
MTLKTSLMGAVVALCALAASAASSATLSVTGGAAAALPGNFSLAGPAYDALSGGVGGVGDAVSVLTSATKTPANGLSLTGNGFLTFTFLGSEAGFSNVLSFGGADVFGNKVNAAGDVSATFAANAGFLPFSFESRGVDTAANDGLLSAGLRIAYSEVFNGGRSVLAFFDDKTTDIDYDDFAVRIDVSEIPIPAGGWLLLTALGGVMLLARRARRRDGSGDAYRFDDGLVRVR